MAAQLGGGLGMAAGAVGAVVLVVAGYVVYEATRGPDPAPTPIADPAPVSEQAPVMAAPETGDPATHEANTENAQSTTGALEGTSSVQTPEQTAAIPLAPSFDLVRVEADGATIIAGLAEPGSEVHVVLDGKDVAVVQADSAGNFVAMMDIGLADKPRVITLTSVMEGGPALTSGNSAIIEPTPQALVVQTAEVEPDATPEMPLADGSEAAQMVEAQVADAPQPDQSSGDADTRIVAPDIAQEDAPDIAQGGENTQSPPDPAGQPTTPVVDIMAEGTDAATQIQAQSTEPALAETAQTTTQEPTALSEAGGSDPTPQVAQDSAVPAVDSEPVVDAQLATAAPAAQPDVTDAPPAIITDAAGANEAESAEVNDAEVTATDGTDDTAVTGADLAGTDATDEVTTTGADATALQDSDESVAEATSTEPAPPRVMIAGGEGITVVQDGGRGPVALESVTLDAITYDAIGEVQLSGRGAGAGNVRVYLDNNPIRTTRIAEDGQWRTGLPEVESGIYTLRVDELREDGSVASRIETPFKREDAGQLAAVAAEVAGDNGRAPVQAITVQPGSTLWAIARESYGEGMLYVRVFEANRDQIRDPDWIYPGQVFAIPGE